MIARSSESDETRESNDSESPVRYGVRCRLGLHKQGPFEPARRKTKRFQAYETYCVRCDKRLT